jgi:F0F1-type ATP synthase alpha subunit
MVDERTRTTIEHGRRIRAVIGQRQFAPLDLGEQVALLVALAEGILDTLSIDRIDDFRKNLLPWLKECCPEIITLDEKADALPEALRGRLIVCLQELAQKTSEHGPDARKRPVA